MMGNPENPRGTYGRRRRHTDLDISLANDLALVFATALVILFVMFVW